MQKGQAVQTLKELRGIGPKRLEALRCAGIITPEALLDTLPRRYLMAQSPVPINQIREGEVCVEGDLADAPRVQYLSGRSIVRASLKDKSGVIKLLWFNQPWIKNQLQKGQHAVLFGQVRRAQNAVSLINPKIIPEKGIIPVYRLLPGIPGKVMSGFAKQAITGMEGSGTDPFPEQFREAFGLLEKTQAWRQAHFPENEREIRQAQRRFAFENLLLYQMALRAVGAKGSRGIPVPCGPEDASLFWEAMPFIPTAAQRKTLDQIMLDMSSHQAMRRLVQGDVGSGKTAVAFGATVMAVKAGYQCAIMAPTELLARQHRETAEHLLTPLGINSGLLTGSIGLKERREALLHIANGDWQLVIGTHALISTDVVYHRLGLVVTDEQHRFGVRQRQRLADQAGPDIVPNILALSATPIPRSLALVFYGDLDVSVMDEMPPGRLLVKTRIVPENKRHDLYQFIRTKAAAGEQSYLVCPLVTEDGEDDRKSAVSMYEALRRGPLSGIPMGLVYGSQKSAEKEQAFWDFCRGNTAVLVSTTVVEVGMDVPRATTMVVEDAESFGLAQLHQLRGRVGRGSGESWCFLLGEENDRLKILTKSSDGFYIAQKDLELRGPGEFFGTRQHGKLLDAYGINDVRLIEETRACISGYLDEQENAALRLKLMLLAGQKYGERLRETGLH